MGDPNDSDWYASFPYSVRYECQANAELGQSTTDLVDDMQRRWGDGVTSFLATDEYPLHFEFILYGQTLDEKVRAANAYLEISTAAARAPTFYVKSPPCETVPIGSGYVDGWPIIAQQGPTVPPGAPNPATMPVHASIAVGALAFMDLNPCSRDFDASYNDRLCVFDGRSWWALRPGLFGPGTGSGAFYLYRGNHDIKLTIMATSIKVEMWARAPSPNEYSWCVLPREYQGPFNTMRGGFAMSCQVSNWSWSTCVDTLRCIWGSYPYATPGFDNIVLYGGEPVRSPFIVAQPAPQDVRVGAAATFSITAGGTKPLTYRWQKDLVNLTEDGHYEGTATPTLTVLNAGVGDVARYRCMVTNPYGYAASHEAVLALIARPGDYDFDDDVDLTDFGQFQACFNGPNRPPLWPDYCADKDADQDGDVDLMDFGIFQSCFNGPNRPPKCL